MTTFIALCVPRLAGLEAVTSAFTGLCILSVSAERDIEPTPRLECLALCARQRLHRNHYDPLTYVTGAGLEGRALCGANKGLRLAHAALYPHISLMPPQEGECRRTYQNNTVATLLVCRQGPSLPPALLDHYSSFKLHGSCTAHEKASPLALDEPGSSVLPRQTPRCTAPP